MTNLLKQLAIHLNAELRRDGEWHANCPYCGKPMKRGDTHFSFSDKGFKCFVGNCGVSGSLRKLAKHVGLDTGDYIAPSYTPEPIKVESSVFPYSLIERYERHPKRIELWQAYKPIPEELIIRYRLGVGKLPDEKGGFMKTDRLTIPFIRDGKLVMLRGRAMNNHPVKWMTCGSPARLFNGESITRDCIVIVMENQADALVGWDYWKHENGVPVASSGGAGTWLTSWSEYIRKVNPRGVLIAMDNDKAGQEGGVKVANSLRAARYLNPIQFHQYGEDAPYKSSLVDNLGVINL